MQEGIEEEGEGVPRRGGEWRRRVEWGRGWGEGGVEGGGGGVRRRGRVSAGG